MNRISFLSRLWIFLAILILLISCRIMFPPAKTPEQHLQKTISHMIRLLEKGKYREMLETSMDPVLLEGLQQMDLFDHTLNQFAGEPATLLLHALRNTVGTHPEMNADKTMAVFLPANYPYPLKFVRDGEKWHLMQ